MVALKYDEQALPRLYITRTQKRGIDTVNYRSALLGALQALPKEASHMERRRVMRVIAARYLLTVEDWEGSERGMPGWARRIQVSEE